MKSVLFTLHYRIEHRGCFKTKRENWQHFGQQRIGILCPPNCQWNGKFPIQYFILRASSKRDGSKFHLVLLKA